MPSAELPPEDQPDTIDIGPITGIPIIEDDDPRFVEERQAWSRATAAAQAMHTPETLLIGIEHEDWRVRHEIIDRLAVRASQDERIVPALLQHLHEDPAWEVRDKAAMAVSRFDTPDVVAALRLALNDEHPDVRWSAKYSLTQLGYD